MKIKSLKTGCFVLIFSLLLAGLVGTAHAAAVKFTPPAGAIPAATQGESYTTDVVAWGGNAPWTWTPASGTNPSGLPPGLNWTTDSTGNATGTISGKPSTTGTFTFTVRACDRAAQCSPVTYTITVVAGTGCAFVPAGAFTGVIAFGAIDPSTSPGPVSGSASTQVNFTCEDGKAFNVTANPLSGWTLTGPSASSMPYTLGFILGGNGQGSTQIALLTTSQILRSNYQDAPYGNYANSSAITLTINCPTCSTPNNIVATINATANIAKACSWIADGTITFDIDPSITPGPITASTSANGTTPQVSCTKDLTPAPTVSCTSTTNTLTLSGGTDPIAYTITCPANITGNGFSTKINIPVGISIARADYGKALTGEHSDTITITVAY
jgi:hypothetical protein